MKYLLGLFLALALVGCQVAEVPSEHRYGVLVAVGSGGSIYRSLVDIGEEVAMGNPNLPSSRILQGDYTFAGNVNILGAFTQGNQNQQSGVNVSGAAGQIGSVTNPYFGDEYVRGTLYQQIGQQWVGPITNPFGANTIRSVAFGNGVYVAVSDGGQTARSTDFGATWANIANNFVGANILAIAYGNGVFVAVSFAGTISRSTDYGVTWSALIVNPFGGGAIYSISYGNGVFVAGSTPALLARSTDYGVTWTLTANPLAGQPFFSISFGNGVFVAFMAGQIIRSLDLGVTWIGPITNPFAGNIIYSSSYGNGVFIAGGNGGTIARSIDNGNTWGSLVTNPFGIHGIYSMSYNFGVFQAGAGAGLTARSYDNGVTWGSLVTNPFGSNSILGIASSTNNMVAVGVVGSIATAGWNAALSKIIEQPYTPTFTGFGAVTAINVTYTIVGNRLKVMGKATSGIATAVEARISFPNGLISDATLIPSITVCGIWGQNASGNAGGYYCLVESGTGYITISSQSAITAILTKQLGNAIIGNGNVMTFQFELPLSGYNT